MTFKEDKIVGKPTFAKYSDMYIRIKHKMNNIQVSMKYGLTNNDKAFLEMVSDLLKDE